MARAYSQDLRDRVIDAALAGAPPYTPDFNLIENAFSKLKSMLRKAPSAQSMPCGTPSAL
jgi:transposase